MIFRMFLCDDDVCGDGGRIMFFLLCTLSTLQRGGLNVLQWHGNNDHDPNITTVSPSSSPIPPGPGQNK